MSDSEYDEAVQRVEKYLSEFNMDPDKSTEIKQVTPESICQVYATLVKILESSHELHHRDDVTFEDQVNGLGSTLDFMNSLITVNLEGLRNFYLTHIKNNKN